MRAPLRGARTSARLAPLADKLLASLAQFTHSMMLAQNHTRRQAPSAHRSRCSLIQCFRETLLAQNHTRRQVPSAHRSRCSLIQHFQETPLISLAQNHMHPERRHLPIARVARSFSARLAHIQLRNSTFYPLGAPPGGQYGRQLVAR